MVQKGVYSLEYMYGWEKFNETSLPEKEYFYSHINMEIITDADNTHTKRVCKDFEIKDLGDYHDLYVQNDTLWLADVFENFPNLCLEIYELGPANFLPVTGLGLQAALTDIKMLLTIQKSIRGGYVTLLIDIQKLTTHTWQLW